MFNSFTSYSDVVYSPVYNCTKNVYNLWVQRGRTSAYPSTTPHTAVPTPHQARVQPTTSTHIMNSFTPSLSTRKNSPLSPLIRYLSTLSTAPTITKTNKK